MSPDNLAPKYSQVDSRLTWNDAADRYTVFAYVKNLQNKTNADAVLGYYISTRAGLFESRHDLGFDAAANFRGRSAVPL